ncbi:endo mannanase GH76 family [Penicillium argentinense]|uniref:Mannan endo-1,6-alpha-mannosidase n=1 Tax=Penicillium argentinense TaxID=1131581 RepID=A0A9W9G3E5_9EURO|nr:endo mannanase GH76 family [Penicillium argentinense]KAJ5110945.1 endo mannanase GH76 family [Penicillium argentinense]
MLGGSLKAAFAAALLAGSAAAIDLDIKDEQSIKDAAKTIASSTMSYYANRDSADIPGAIVTSWWEGGLLFDIMIQYWSLTGDDSNNDAVTEGMYWQRGSGNNYFPSNYSSYLGNDDQLTWGLAAMTAAELDYPQNSSMLTWAMLAENVWNVILSRWDEENCYGGLRWQIWPYQIGYTMKNAYTNGAFFELSARLGRFTKNQTYVDWAEKIWEWSAKSSLLDVDTWKIYDSTNCKDNCEAASHIQWSYNYGTYMTGAAYMYNQVSSSAPKQNNGGSQANNDKTDGKDKWKTALNGLFNTSQIFFPEKYGGKIMSEVTCEPQELCNDEILFKGLFAQDLSLIAQVAPYTESNIIPLLQGSAVAAAKSCTGGTNDDLCGIKWYKSEYDGRSGFEQQLSATSILMTNMIAFGKQAPATQATASKPASGTSTGSPSSTSNTLVIKTDNADKDNGAGVLSGGPVAVVVAVMAGILYLI